MFTLGATARAALARAPARALPCLVLDLDETLLHRPGGALDWLALYAWRTAAVGVPYAHALTSLHALSSAYNLVAVTARFALAEANTARWLAAQGLPHLPVLYAAGVHAGDGSRGAFKASAIEHLRTAGWAPAAGVGDRPSDLQAYASAGLLACMVVHAEGSAGGSAGGSAARRLVEERARHPGARVRFFSDCAPARAALGLGGSEQGAASVWQQVTACLLEQPPLLAAAAALR
jgi:hypothetical protein